MGQNLLSVVVPVNARAVWRQHVTSLADAALGRHGAVLADVGVAVARTVLSGGQVYAYGAEPGTRIASRRVFPSR